MEKYPEAAVDTIKVTLDALASHCKLLEAEGSKLRDELREKDAQLDRMQDALNKIHDLAGQMGDIHPHVGAIQAWVHEVSPCEVKQDGGVQKLIEAERALAREVRCECGVPGCNKLYDHRK